MGKFSDSEVKCVIFDCDGVLVDSVSSWKTLHDHFGTDNSLNLKRFINGELTDVELVVKHPVILVIELKCPHLSSVLSVPN